VEEKEPVKSEFFTVEIETPKEEDIVVTFD
jgi:hypothetical protein